MKNLIDVNNKKGERNFNNIIGYTIAGRTSP